MSLIARNVARVVPKNARSYALTVEAPAKEWAAKREAIKEHAHGSCYRLPVYPFRSHLVRVGTTDLWRKIRFVLLQ